jgi:hypothetical protein
VRAILASLLLAVALSVASVSPTAAAPADDAYEAYQAGDYATAPKSYSQLARQGDASMQWVDLVAKNRRVQFVTLE